MPSATAGWMIAAAPAAQPALPDELLEDIFLRLDDAADLARVYASCTSFRRIVSERRFLRRYRSLHRPPVLGFLDCTGLPLTEFYPAEPLHRSAPAAAALARDADFTLPFLSDPSTWRVRDVRDGRILLSQQAYAGYFSFRDLIICDPLHRRHIRIPLFPQDLVPSAPTTWRYDPFLAPATEKEKEEEEDGLPFRVICNVLSNDDEHIRSFVFSSVTGEWRTVTPFDTGSFRWLRYRITLRRHHAYSCFYWIVYGRALMLVLETGEMKFSLVELPPESKFRSKYTLVEAGEGRLGLLILSGRMLYIYSRAWPNNGDEDWRYDNAIPLADRCWSFGGGAEGYALLKGVTLNHCQIPVENQYTLYLTVELKTLLVKRLCATKSYTITPDYLYASFPPPLSLPSL